MIGVLKSDFNKNCVLFFLHIENILGISLERKEIVSFLKRAGYESAEDLDVKVPEYRQDILHEVDVIEDICIMYGYENIKSLDIKDSTSGNALKIVAFSNKIREILVGLGFQ